MYTVCTIELHRALKINSGFFGLEIENEIQLWGLEDFFIKLSLILRESYADCNANMRSLSGTCLSVVNLNLSRKEASQFVS